MFPSRKGGAPLYPRAVNRMIKPAAERAGVNPAVSAHWLRHAHASHALGCGATVGEVLESLYGRFDGLRERLADGDGELRSFVNVYVGGEDISFLDGLATPVGDGAELNVLPAVAGG